VRLVDEAGCARRVRLPDALLAPVPERPGVFVIHVAGHTPGSQVVIAFLDTGRGPAGVRRIALAGDAANVLDGVLHDVPKPLLYRLLVVPESDARLGEVRRLLAAVGREGGFELAVSHDGLALERDGFLSAPVR
jgi:glyoxylase-like metal-dependent hydrolase (beta-lactamase superfamily II)